MAVIAVAVVLVGLSSSVGAESEGGDTAGVSDAVFGVAMTMLGTFVQSVQYTYEEKVMSGDISAPPWLLIGVEGLTGTVLCTFVLYPLAWLCPGPDHGHFEDPYNTYVKLANSPTACYLALTFCVLVFVLNSFSVLVTYMMSSVWHAILDNFRPITIWVVELLLFYSFTSGQFGEAWTDGSWLQLAGMVILLFGTAVYNGSVRVPGVASDELMTTAPKMSTPALARSPLITLNPASSPVFSATHRSSPYVTRVRLEGGGDSLLPK